jgi:hypothetical protein
MERLQQRDTVSTALESHVAVETLETLQFSLEKLRVAEEEMRQQYEELAATRPACRPSVSGGPTGFRAGP